MTNPINPANYENYHIYNRGAGKQITFSNKLDYRRFVECLKEFNTSSVVHSLFRVRQQKRMTASSSHSEVPLVKIKMICLLPNHYHVLLEQVYDDGISKFMQKNNAAHTKFFNEKYDKSGALFQGRYKRKHVNSDAYMKQLLAYVGFNNIVHGIETTKCFTVHNVELETTLDKSSVIHYFGSWSNFLKEGLLIALKIKKSRDAKALNEEELSLFQE